MAGILTGFGGYVVKEYAADSCANECKDLQLAAQEKLQPTDTEGQAKLKVPLFPSQSFKGRHIANGCDSMSLVVIWG